MFGNSFLSVSVINNLIGLVLTVFILTLAITYYNKRKKRKNDSELNVKIDSYMNQHLAKTTEEYEDNYDNKTIKHPKLHLLKIVQSGNEFTIYFVNKGNKVFNINISSSDVSDILIEPNDNISQNSTGYIKFTRNKKSDNKITFKLDFTDGRMNKISKKYLLTVLENKMEEID